MMLCFMFENVRKLSPEQVSERLGEVRAEFWKILEDFECQVVLLKPAKRISNEFWARLGTQCGSLWG